MLTVKSVLKCFAEPEAQSPKRRPLSKEKREPQFLLKWGFRLGSTAEEAAQELVKSGE